MPPLASCVVPTSLRQGSPPVTDAQSLTSLLRASAASFRPEWSRRRVEWRSYASRQTRPDFVGRGTNRRDARDEQKKRFSASRAPLRSKTSPGPTVCAICEICGYWLCQKLSDRQTVRPADVTGSVPVLTEARRQSRGSAAQRLGLGVPYLLPWRPRTGLLRRCQSHPRRLGQPGPARRAT